jgi:microcystin degradation protein MlrC
MDHAHRVAAASIMHESNSFSKEPTRLSDFNFRSGSDRNSTLTAWAANRNEVAGFLDGAVEVGFEILPIVYAVATPSGPVSAETFEELAGVLVQGLRSASPFDGVLLALHGAMFSETYPHADEELVRRVRSEIGPGAPLVVTHDFHANISPEIVALCDALISYQQNPHIDTWDRGLRAARLMGRILRGEIRPRQALAKPPMLWNIVHQNTFAEPLLPITQASIDLEKQPGILAASVACGYQYNDVPHLGPSVVVVTDDDETSAGAAAVSLSKRMWERPEATRLNLPNAVAAVEAAIRAERFPVGLFDAGDNIGGGSPGDETALVAEFVRQRAQGWVAALCDREAVAAAVNAGIGAAFELPVGGKSIGSHTTPVRIRGVVRSLHDGRFVEPEVRHGGQNFWDMGTSVVIEQEDSTPEGMNYLLITSKRCCPFSLGQLTSCGITPGRQRILAVKGTVAPRAAYEPVCASIILVDTPGVTSVNPRCFEFRRVRPGVLGLQ